MARKTTAKPKIIEQVGEWWLKMPPICVMALENGENLTLGSDPKDDEVLGFVKGWNELHPEGDPERLMSATFYPWVYQAYENKLGFDGRELDISEYL